MRGYSASSLAVSCIEVRGGRIGGGGGRGTYEATHSGVTGLESGFSGLRLGLAGLKGDNRGGYLFADL